jgi:ribosomal protein S18 acetylase RimI-like enzyme
MFYAGGGTLDGRQQQQQQMFRPRGGLEGFPPAADYRNSRNSFRSNHNMRGGYVAGGGGEPKIVAYVLGKVERRPVIDYEYPIEVRQDYYGGGRRRHTGHIETLGHVTSLAVLSEYRRLGLGRALMEQLQCHMQYYGGGHPGGADGHVTSCGLHVRVSNQAAYRLYQNDGYEIESVLPHYYQDGEEAYYMRKMLPPRSHRQTYTAFDNPLFGNKKVWKHGPEHMRLPRIHCAIVEEQEDHLDQQQIATESSSLGSSNSNNNEEWLTGSI